MHSPFPLTVQWTSITEQKSSLFPWIKCTMFNFYVSKTFRDLQHSWNNLKKTYFKSKCLSVYFCITELHRIDLPFLFCMTQVQMKAVAKSDYGINYSFVLIPNQWPCYQISPSVQCIRLHQSSINNPVMLDLMDSWSNGSFSEGQGFWINWLETLSSQTTSQTTANMCSPHSPPIWSELCGLQTVVWDDGSRREQCGLRNVAWDLVETLADSVFLRTQTTHHSTMFYVYCNLLTCIQSYY